MEPAASETERLLKKPVLNRLSNIRKKLQGMTAPEIAGQTWLRAQRASYRALRRVIDKPNAVFITNSDLGRALGGKPLAEVAARIRERREPRLLPGLSNLPQTVAT